MSSDVRVVGVLVTYRRAALLESTLKKIARQTRPLDQILVVDNENSPATCALIDRLAEGFPTKLRYVATPSNLGSAGGWAFGMSQFVQEGDFDWLMPLDDDDPPEDDRDFDRMIEFAVEARGEDDKVGAVGIVGAQFDWRKGLIQRLPDDQLVGRVPVDFVGSGNIPLYHRSAMDELGVFDSDLFFGYTEVEYGLRLKRAGFEILANAEMWRERRANKGRIGVSPKPSRVCVVSPRKYYAIRNHVYIMRKHRRLDLVAKQAAIQCVLKPLYTLFSAPKLAISGLAQAVTASSDGFFGRMGRRKELATGQRDNYELMMCDGQESGARSQEMGVP